MELNTWSGLFLFSAIQALFLISVVWLYRRENKVASVFLTLLLCCAFIANVDYFILASGLYKSMPNLFGISNGLILLIGPGLYFYIRSVLDEAYRLKPRILVHLIPYVVNAIVHLPFMFMSASARLQFIRQFLEDAAPLNVFLVVLFSLQLLHFCIYLWKSHVHIVRAGRLKETYRTTMADRLKWVKWIYGGLASYGIFVVIFALWCFATYSFNHLANYLYTLCLSCITIILAYGIVLRANWVLPDFSKRYTAQHLPDSQKAIILDHLLRIMRQKKPFLDPDLKMEDLAAELAISKHGLSQLINQEFSQNFKTFLNAHRVEEFMELLRRPQLQHLDLFGIAQEAGFRSKSTFNTAFRSHTGLTPSEYKKGLQPK